jgi:hypothetical protein
VGTFVDPLGVVTGIVDGPPDFMFFRFSVVAPLPSELPLPLVPAPGPPVAPPALAPAELPPTPPELPSALDPLVPPVPPEPAPPPLAPPAPPAPPPPDWAKAAALSAKAKARADIVTIFFICLSS